jgi:cytochrome c nitrite reductase small subunit
VLARSGDGIWPWVLAVATGVATGVGVYTFSYAKGLSYFGTDPRACVNCHIMEPQYAGWQKASHHAVAGCIDCHLPTAFIPKYLAKAENGYRHGKLFTTQSFEEPITIKPAGRAILQANCERCHEALVADMIEIAGPSAPSPGSGPVADEHTPSEPPRDGVTCVHCHSSVGHGERAGMGGPLRASELMGQDTF